MAPYLKGFHLTLDSWRSKRAEDGWKFSRTEWLAIHTEGCEVIDSAKNEEAPDTVIPVVPFVDDLCTIEILLESSEPIKKLLRLGLTAWVAYGAGMLQVKILVVE